MSVATPWAVFAFCCLRTVPFDVTIPRQLLFLLGFTNHGIWFYVSAGFMCVHGGRKNGQLPHQDARLFAGRAVPNDIPNQCYSFRITITVLFLIFLHFICSLIFKHSLLTLFVVVYCGSMQLS